MRALRSVSAFLLLLVLAAWRTPAPAPPSTVTLSIPGMTCSTCPITIRRALSKVPGVTHVVVRYETREAEVTFDASRTTPAALMKATRDAGYPSTLKPPSARTDTVTRA